MDVGAKRQRDGSRCQVRLKPLHQCRRIEARMTEVDDDQIDVLADMLAERIFG